ncbi:MAG: Gfo/Idh/MocA family oxidoreductase [Armatimonadetes bacterium]|nr:Gfo/Idh/MocA family oxidoreductase [Armatimonadota bacterium]
MNEPSTGRRHFLQQAAAAAALAGLSAPARAQAPAAGTKLNIAGIGIGGMGGGNLARLTGENIVALCDVDANYAAGTVARFPGAKFYTDYRELFAQQKDLDAVVIATPDHTHAVIAAAAMRAGKHVYCQKPLTHSVWEARQLATIAAETKVVTQMGIQGHSGGGIRKICEWIWAGAIGEVRSVDAWCSLSYYPWGHAGWSSQWGARPKETMPIPQGLNWDLWLGPAPERPYHRAYHPTTWRCWWDFGVGMMGDRGAHTLDSAFWALKLGAPSSIEATSCGLNPDTHPLSAIVTYRFPARAGLPPLKLTWYEGTRPPRPEELPQDIDLPDEGGIIFNGSEGRIVAGVYGGSPFLLPQALQEGYKRPAPTIPRVPEENHEMDWVRAIREGKKAGADFAYSGPLTEMCLLGNVAKRLDARIEWDAGNLKVTNRDDAAVWVKVPYRAGWTL